MCGIIGVFDSDGKRCLPEAILRTGLERLRSRGPDAEGTYTAPGLALGHRRLVVIDPEGGRQPFTDPDTGVTLVFNGEIFNFRELRRELEGRGHAFADRSDTEVLLHAYLEWGRACLARLRGMFAFAVYDPRHALVLLARDRLGIKPLFFSHRGTTLRFASSCAALRAFPEVGPDMDPAAVSHYLTTIRTTLGHRTLLRDVQTLLPGQCLTVSRAQPAPTIETYWTVPIVAAAEKESPGLEQASQRLREMLEESVASQLVSDVPLGGFLSGGLDSSILSSLAHRLTGGNFHAYSVGYDRDGYNEWPYVRAAARRYGMRCREIHLEEAEYPGLWSELVRCKGLPVSTPNEIAICRLARALKQDYTVALSGEGADEIFGGYTISQFAAYDFDRARRAEPAPGEEWSGLDRALQRLYGRPCLPSRLEHYFLLNSWIPLGEKIRLLTEEAWRNLRNDAALFGFYGGWFERLEACSTFDAYMHIHVRINLEGLLSRVDSSTMAASVEARVPFTDHPLVEWLFRLPDRYKIGWGRTDGEKSAADKNILELHQAGLLESKRLLRRAFRDDVPREILERPKMSFAVPFAESLAGWLKALPGDLPAESPLVGTLFRPDTIRALLQDPDPRRSAMALWPVANLCLWQHECGATWNP
jgi:asparagine synthase (glutamine-hydrolysing)